MGGYAASLCHIQFSKINIFRFWTCGQQYIRLGLKKHNMQADIFIRKTKTPVLSLGFTEDLCCQVVLTAAQNMLSHFSKCTVSDSVRCVTEHPQEKN